MTSFTYKYHYETIEQEELPIQKFTNLKELTIANYIHSRSSFEGNNHDVADNIIKSIPNTVTRLILDVIVLTQRTVDELSTLTQLKELTLNELNLSYKEKLNFDGLKNFNKKFHWRRYNF